MTPLKETVVFRQLTFAWHNRGIIGAALCSSFFNARFLSFLCKGLQKIPKNTCITNRNVV